jgi:hypothetical protein
MTDRDTAELWDKLREVRRQFPDMRVGQLIANLAVVARGTDPGAVWDMEDDELLSAVKWQLAELGAKTADVA